MKRQLVLVATVTALVLGLTAYATVSGHEGDNDSNRIHACVSSAGQILITTADGGDCPTGYTAHHWDIEGGGADVLVRVSDAPVGDDPGECPLGGSLVEIGLDTGDGSGGAPNQELDDDEVTDSFVICKSGIVGVQYVLGPSTSISNNTHKTSRSVAYCPAGKKVIGGSHQVLADGSVSDEFEKVNLAAAIPVAAGLASGNFETPGTAVLDGTAVGWSVLASSSSTGGDYNFQAIAICAP